MNGCAPGLALIERLKATRKWAIVQLNIMARYQCQNYVCLNVLNLYWH